LQQLNTGTNPVDHKLPVVSFSIPTYNAGEFLDVCLKSIFSQNYPHDKIEVLISDGGSTDETVKIAESYGIKVSPNPQKLADFGTQINVSKAKGDLLIIFAADNEIPDRNWLRVIAEIFLNNSNLACLWCDMICSYSDPPINKYYELIKSDPLMFSINKNLQWYVKYGKKNRTGDVSYLLFHIEKEKPLVWGANGLVYRMKYVKHIILREGFIGDNDVFQTMVDEGNQLLAFSFDLKVVHHHLKSLNHWMSKWKRNYQQHLISQLSTRNMRWMLVKNFKTKVVLWLIYSIFPLFSVSHTVFLIIKDRNIYWAYHPLACLAQAIFLLKMTLSSKDGRKLLSQMKSGNDFE
jgi:glycosyltransferase involved in cell wall biosynthesis